MEMMKNKKAILFTFISVVIAGLLLTMYSTHQITPIDQNVGLEKAKTTIANEHLMTTFAYAESSMKISSYMAFQSMIKHIHDEGHFFNDEVDINESFQDCMLDGSFGVRSVHSGDCDYMENFTIYVLMDNLQNKLASEFAVNMSYSINDVWVDQANPFSVISYLNMSLSLRFQNIQWNITNVSVSKISILGLQDPIYFNIGYNSTFKKAFTLRESYTNDTFQQFVENGEYLVTSVRNMTISGVGTFRPLSFFGRLTNEPDIKNHPSLTLLSIINPQKLVDEGLPRPGNESYVDFMYGTQFNEINCIAVLRKVVDTQNRPIVDKYHLSVDFNQTGGQVEVTNTC
ncbi:hypothetical protein H8D36_03020 [archaeon]|nr:hypothetical protein [archaeon]MBL7057042.1 hypothetical protein [Candidatus Woesearchaeota archaeon]